MKRLSIIAFTFYCVTLRAQNPSFSPTFFPWDNCAPYTVSLVNNTHISIDTTNMTFEWDFGDGTTLSTYDATHTYTKPSSVGSYQISLLARDAMGNVVGQRVYSSPFNIIGSSGDFNTTASNGTACINEPITFYSTSNADDYVEWDLGDGSPISNAYTFTHSYSAAGSYTVTFYYYSSSCANDTATKVINVSNNALPISQITQPTTTVFCPNDIIAFNPLYNQNYSFQWDFADGSQSTSPAPTHAFSSIGTYSVVLTTTNICNNTNKDTIVMTIDNSTPSNSGFNIVPLMGPCPYSLFRFVPFSPTGNFFWDFGDGETSSLKSPEHIYRDTGVFITRLVVINNCGNPDTTFKTATIQYNPNSFVDLPIIQFEGQQGNIDTLVVCPGEEVSFLNQTYDQNWIYSYLWVLGDGDSATTRNTKHTYTAPGLYPVSMKITNGCGVSDTAFKWVRVSNTVTPVANRQVMPNTICPGEKVYFFDQSFNRENNYVYSIWFGNGDSLINITDVDSVVPVFASATYSSEGTYTYKFVVTNLCGNSDTLTGTISVISNNNNPFFFVGNDADNINSGACPGIEIPFYAVGGQSFLWNFGDGTLDTNAITTHAYSSPGVYTASVTITTACGVVSTQTTTAYVNNSIFLNTMFTQTSNYVCANDSVFFSIAANNQFSDQNTYLWEFGDGDSANTQHAAHVYDAPGTYPILLTVSNGCTSSSRVGSITVTAPNVNITTPLLASFCIDAIPVSIMASPSGGVYSGSGISGNTFNPSIAGVGQHVLTYSYIDGIGCSASDSDTTTVYALPNPGLQSSTPVCADIETISITATGGGGYYWSNGATTASIDVSATTSLYTVTVTDNNGCSNTDTTSILINPLPTLTLSASDTVLCSGESCLVTASSSASFVWNTGSSASSLDVSPTISTWYSATATNLSTGCSKTDSLQIVVEDCTGIIEDLASGLSVYPNPATNQVTIEYVGNLLQLKIMDVNGRVVFAQNILTANYKQQINTETFTKGVYTIQLVTKTGTVNKRLIIN